MIELHLHAMR